MRKGVVERKMFYLFFDNQLKPKTKLCRFAPLSFIFLVLESRGYYDA